MLLEAGVYGGEDNASFLFRDPHAVVTLRHGDDVSAFFASLESYHERGFWLCGYCAYELGYYLEDALAHLRRHYDFPLAWFMVCKKPRAFDRAPRRTVLPRHATPSLPRPFNGLFPSIEKINYDSSIAAIKKYLKAGLTYQVNYTFPMRAERAHTSIDIYRYLRTVQPTPYMAFINAEDRTILSFSPELFFRRRNDIITVRPMKGTSARGVTLEEDRKKRQELSSSDKIRAENVMIVDLLRNDLGRIAKKVWVPRLFEIEKHGTLYQMTSTVKARVPRALGIKELFTALFPSGSVTGAPKIKTMELIASLERAPRGIYTGAIGYIAPSNDACFNVAIRTLEIEGVKAKAGVGGGIVADSLDSAEYEEALLKARFLSAAPEYFSLIETMRLEEDGTIAFLGLHLNRLKKSCEYFDIPLAMRPLRRALMARGKSSTRPAIIRLLVARGGTWAFERKPLSALRAPVRVALSAERINPTNVFLYHKTTNRAFYDEAHAHAKKNGFFDVLFFNAKRELTEGAISNVFIRRNGVLLTPPVRSGLLPGVLRAHLLRTRQACETILRYSDICRAEKIYVGNSVRGLLEAKIISVQKKESKEMHHA